MNLRNLINELKILPDFARYLLDHKLDELARDQLDLARELGLPLLEYFKKFREAELLTMCKQDMSRLLTAIRDQKLNEYIYDSVLRLQNNQLPQIIRDNIRSDDVATLSLMRRKILRKKIFAYNPDSEYCIEALEELDLFLTTLDSKIFDTFSKFQTDLFDQAQKIAHIGNWVLDLKTNFISWSKELFSIYHLPYQDKITFDIGSFNHPDDSMMVKEKMEISRQSKKPCDFVYRIILHSGEIRYLHARVHIFLNISGDAEKMFGTVQDITDQKKLEQEILIKSKEIEEQENLYHRMINEVEDYAILLLSDKGIIENWNIGAEKIKGYKAEEIIGKHISVFYPLDDQIQKLPEQLIKHASIFGKANHEGWRIRKDGSKFWGSIVITALHDQKGNVVGFTKVTRDLTLKKIAEDSLKEYSERLEKQNLELSRKNEELESFNYIAGHDLQEPVRKIRIWLNKIDEQQDIPVDLQSPIARIKTSVNRLQLLLNGILEYTQTDITNLHREQIDLNIVLDEVFTDLAETTDQKNVEIVRNLFPIFTGVRIQFYQLFFNIISNSIKYRNPETHLLINCFASVTDKIHLLFIDNGIGFKQEYSDKIFDLFSRLDPVSNTMGTGLGLAICKKIVQNHSGSISAKSEPGSGTRIEIILPIE